MKTFLAITAVLLLAGCTAKFYRHVDGIQDTVAVSLPDEDTVKIQLLEYLSGSKTYVKDPSVIDHQFATAATNEYFWGMIKVNEHRVNHIVITPTNVLEKARN